MKANYVSRNIYVSLDELLDTRLGSLYERDESLVQYVLDHGYYDRLRDDYPKLPFAEFREIYESRSATALLHSVRTYVLDIIIEALFKLHGELINEPFRGLPILTINSYPYELGREVQDEFSSVVQEIAGDAIPIYIDWIRVAPKDLTPKFAGSTYAMMFMYDYLYWMDMHGGSFEGSDMVHVELIGPGLFIDKEVSGEEVIDESSGARVHPFEALRLIARQIVNLRIIPAKYFSMISPENTLKELSREDPKHNSFDEFVKELEKDSLSLS